MQASRHGSLDAFGITRRTINRPLTIGAAGTMQGKPKSKSQNHHTKCAAMCGAIQKTYCVISIQVENSSSQKLTCHRRVNKKTIYLVPREFM